MVDGECSEIIYLSVLGDMDGDGLINGSDIADISKYIRGKNGAVITDLEVEYRLAGFLNNNGMFSAQDITIIQAILGGTQQSSDLFYKG